MEENCKTAVSVSVIIPVYNAQDFLGECFEAVRNQETQLTDSSCNGCQRNADGRNIDDTMTTNSCCATTPTSNQIHVEVSIFDDGSTDNSPDLIRKWIEIFNSLPFFSTKFSFNPDKTSKGVGYAKNRAAEQSTGEYLCFCDADDVMEPNRIVEQYKATLFQPHLKQNAIIGSQFTRTPEGSTRIFTTWGNNLTQEQLHSQIFSSFGPSLLMPTWFCHRTVFHRIEGGFSEEKYFPEDLLFFYSHLKAGGSLHRVDRNLVMYRYHPNATTFSVPETKIWQVRLQHFEEQVLSLSSWKNFLIWNAGKLGRRFLRSLSPSNQLKVRGFCDVDPKKIKHGSYVPCPNPLKLFIPIIHYNDAFQNQQQQRLPLVICLQTEYTWDVDGPFRTFARENKLEEGRDYYFFN